MDEKNYEIGSIQVKESNDYIGKVQDYRCPSCGHYSVILDTTNSEEGHETCLNSCVSLSLSRKLSIGG